jgi:stage III sporulation protein AE
MRLNDNNSLLCFYKSEGVGLKNEGFSSELSKILESFYELIGEEYAHDAEAGFGVGVDSAVSSFFSLLFGGCGKIGSFLIMLFGVSVLFLACEKLGDLFGDSKRMILSASGAVLSLPVIAALAELVFSVREDLEGATGLFSGLIPVFTAISATGGGAATSLAQGAGMSVTLSVCSVIIKDGLMPILMLMLSLGLLSSFDTGGCVAPLVKGLKSSFIFILGGITTATAGAMALQSVITNAQDSMALRGARFAISGMIPIVGGSISSALGALTSGVEAAKGTVGATALIVLIGILSAPLIQLLLVRVAFRLCNSFLEMTGGTLGARLLTSIQGALDALISIVAFSGVIYILEVIIFIKLGVPTL